MDIKRHYLCHAAQVAYDLVEVEGLAGIALPREDDVLMLLVMQHVLPGFVHDPKDMRLFICQGLEHVAFVVLQSKRDCGCKKKTRRRRRAIKSKLPGGYLVIVNVSLLLRIDDDEDVTAGVGLELTAAKPIAQGEEDSVLVR